MTTQNNPKSDDILKKIFQMQQDYTSLLKLDRYPVNLDEKISVLCTAIIHETTELQRLTSWKWWKKPVPLNQELAKEELIDIWHFVVQASMELELTPEDILKEYERKNQINRQREATGY
ncbi:MAG: dUTP diphosphatase [Thaumarchaeota archaeon]|nr:dUTP diphosphatase [Nitrososphaerota archaeon]|tara:strand:+ start:47 stop:403 length:357 start_codon:yes stop_codon:yes gene_type:complete